MPLQKWYDEEEDSYIEFPWYGKNPPTQENIRAIKDRRRLENQQKLSGGQGTIGPRESNLGTWFGNLADTVLGERHPDSPDRLSGLANELFGVPVPELHELGYKGYEAAKEEVGKAPLGLIEELSNAVPMNPLSPSLGGAGLGRMAETEEEKQVRTDAARNALAESSVFAGDLLSPGDLLTGLGSLGASATAKIPGVASKLLNAARGLDITGSAFALGSGANETIEGINERDPARIAGGLLTGGLGSKSLHGYKLGDMPSLSGEKILERETDLPLIHEEALDENAFRNRQASNPILDLERNAPHINEMIPPLRAELRPFKSERLSIGDTVPNIDRTMNQQVEVHEMPVSKRDLNQNIPRPFYGEEISLEPELTVGASLKKLMGISDTPSAQRGAFDPSGRGLKDLNTFEDAQAIKYGPEWRQKQSDSERARHLQLLYESGAVEDVGDLNGAENDIDFSDPSAVERDLLESGLMSPEELSVPATSGKELSPDEIAGPAIDVSDTIVEDVGVKNPKTVRLPKESVAADMSDDVSIDLPDEDVAAMIEPKDIRVYQRPPKDLVAARGETQLDTVSKEADKALAEQGEKKKSNNVLVELNRASKQLRASSDVSWPGIQGVLTLTRPGAWKGIVQGLKSAKTATHEKTMLDLSQRPNAELYKKYGLAQYGEIEKGISSTDEAPSSVISKLPVIKQSNNVFAAQGDLVRANLFDELAAKWEKNGWTEKTHPELYKKTAEYLNVLTRHADLPKSLAAANDFLGNFLWSPRGTFSDLMLVNPKFYYDLPMPLKKEALRDIAGTSTVLLGMTALTAEALKAAGHDAEFFADPTHTKFGGIQVGKVYINPVQRLAGPIRLLARTISGTKATDGGRFKLRDRFRLGSEDLKQAKGKGGVPVDNIDEITSFFANKATPLIRSGISLYQGEGFGGEEYGGREALRDIAMPMSLAEIAQTGSDYGVGPELAASGLGIGGTRIDIDVPEDRKAKKKSESKKKKKGSRPSFRF